MPTESFFTQASLAYLASAGAGKDGKTYSMKPTDGTGDFTFSRGSNLSATRIGSDGLIEKGRENLLLQSNAFTTSPWLQTDATATSGQSGYDGTNNAWLIDKSGANGRIRQLVSSTGVLTTSVYAKAGTNDWLRISFAKFAYFDLANGVIGNTNALDTTITSVGNGWYRCTMTANSTSTQYANYYPAEDDNVISETSGNIIMQSIQIEQGLAATDYIESGASTGKAGLLEDEPRFDYSGGATCPSLLLEPSRTNLVEQSEYIDGLDKASSPTLSLESETNPSGSAFAYKITATETGSRVQQTIGTQGNNFVFSGFFKGTGTATRIRFRNNQGESVFYDIAANGNFTLYTEDAANDNFGIEDYGNGWHRIYFETTTASGGTDNYIQVYPDVLDGDGSVLVWGLQAEQGSYPTSYIPNHSGGTITRGADTQSQLTIPNGSATEGTIFYEFDKAQASASFDIVPLKVGTNRILRISQYNPNMRFSINENATSYDESNSYNSHIKVAVSYSSLSVKLFINGVLRATDTTYSASGNVIIPANGLQATSIGCSIESKQLLYFPEALSDADCITLTTL